MPRIILPNGEVKYYESEEELSESYVPPETPDVEQPKDDGGGETLDTDTSEEDGGDKKEVKKDKKYQEPIVYDNEGFRVDQPKWLQQTANLLKSIPSSFVSAPNEVVSAAQHRAQTTSTRDMVMAGAGAYGGDAALAMLGSRIGLGLGGGEEAVKEYDEAMGIKGASLALSDKEKERIRRGKAYARQGLLDPETTGGELKEFGIDKDLPIIGTFGKGGVIYDAVRPEGDFANAVTDFGTILVLSGLLGGKGQGPQTFSALRRTAALKNLPKFAWTGLQALVM